MDNQDNNQNTQSTGSPPPQYPPPQYPPPQYPPPSPPKVGHIPGKGKAIVSLVLGIISIVMPIPILGPVAAIIGLVMASLSKKEGFAGGIRTGGLVCSIIGLVAGIVYTIIIFAAGALIWNIVTVTNVLDIHWLH